MINKISEARDFFSRHDCAFFIQQLFDRRALWEDRTRSANVPQYRNGKYYTLGSSIYMDLNSEAQLPAFVQKTAYFNVILQQNFAEFYTQFLDRLNAPLMEPQYQFLNAAYRHAPLPGFHIFPPEETLQANFGKIHRDLQWEQLFQMPDFPFDLADKPQHFTFTLPLVCAYQGSGMQVFESKEHDTVNETVEYKEGALYLHSGQFPHLVLPLAPPVTPMDWRITFQGHGFTIDKQSYLYW